MKNKLIQFQTIVLFTFFAYGADGFCDQENSPISAPVYNNVVSVDNGLKNLDFVRDLVLKYALLNNGKPKSLLDLRGDIISNPSNYGFKESGPVALKLINPDYARLNSNDVSSKVTISIEEKLYNPDESSLNSPSLKGSRDPYLYVDTYNLISRSTVGKQLRFELKGYHLVCYSDYKIDKVPFDCAFLYLNNNRNSFSYSMPYQYIAFPSSIVRWRLGSVSAFVGTWHIMSTVTAGDGVLALTA